MEKPQAKNTKEYLKTRVMTASKEELQLMLYDGAIRFCEQGRAAIEENDIEKSYTLLCKAEKIIMEMMYTLRDEHAPEACANMRGLYLFCYERLTEANMKKEIQGVDDALQVLRHMRETWVLLMKQLKEEQGQTAAPGAPAGKPVNKAAAMMGAMALEVGGTLSIEG